MICANCGEIIQGSSYGSTWVALLTQDGERAENVPHFHWTRPECKKEALRQASFRGSLELDKGRMI